MQLADLPLDQDLVAYAEHALGALVGDRGEALGQARRHDDGVVHPVGLQGGPARLGQVALLDVAGRLALAHGGVDPPQGHAGGRLDLALGERIARPQEGVEHIELRLRQGLCLGFCHRIHHSFTEEGNAVVFEDSRSRGKIELLGWGH